MSARNQPRQFARGIGQFSPWSAVKERVRESLTKQATPRKFRYLHGREAAKYLADRRKMLDVAAAIHDAVA